MASKPVGTCRVTAAQPMRSIKKLASRTEYGNRAEELASSSDSLDAKKAGQLTRPTGFVSERLFSTYFLRFCQHQLPLVDSLQPSQLRGSLLQRSRPATQDDNF